LALFVASPAHAQITLSGTAYVQAFDTIGSGLPAGVTVSSDATATFLGTPGAAFASGTTPWADTTNNFKNVASALTNTGGNGSGGSFNGTESFVQQNASTNRALGLRPAGAFGDPGAAMTFQFTNTLNFANFNLSLNEQTLDPQARTTVYTVRFGLGSSPSSFTTLGTYTTTAAWSQNTDNFVLPSSVNNQSQNLWIQVVNLSASTGTGQWDTFGIDNFVLTFTGVPEPGTVALFGVAGVGAGVLVWRRRRQQKLQATIRSEELV